VTILVIDVGTSGVRAAAVGPDAAVLAEEHRRFPPQNPFPGGVEFDAAALGALALDLAAGITARVGPVRCVGIANQRCSTIVWDRATSRPVGPALGWQDLRTVGHCLTLGAQGRRVAPNASATKVAWLLDTHDPDRSRDLCFGTVDTWLIWLLTGGEEHVTDATNAAVTGLSRVVDGDVAWDSEMLSALNIPSSMLPRIVDSTGVVGRATALAGSPPIAGIAGDQQASLIGQGCVQPGRAKITFGTGGMLDVCAGRTPPRLAGRFPGGTIPIAAWRDAEGVTWGQEAIMLTAGSCVDWLRDDLGIITDAADSERWAAQCTDTGDVWFVPALLGTATPSWDYGARGALVGMTRGTGRAELCRAVLEGVAHAAVDLVEAAELDTGLSIERLCVDGGMTVNSVFVQALADASGRRVEVSPVREATSLGAAFLAGLAVGTWSDMSDIGAAWRPSAVAEPRPGALGRRDEVRARWAQARLASDGWIPALSALDF
jgi:glycerol kinase